MSCLVNCPEFCEAVESLLCFDPKSGGFVSDFTAPIDNALVKAFRDYRKCVGNSNPPALPVDFARILLTNHAGAFEPGRIPLITISEIDIAIERMIQVRERSLEATLPVVLEGFKYWLNKQRVDHIIREVSADAGWDPREMMGRLLDSTAAVEGGVGDDNIQPFGAGLDQADEQPRISTGLRGLDACLGGGLAPGEFTLAIAGTGVGKTVLACQLAGHFSNMGIPGILISTEEPREALDRRILSNFARIPFSKIKDRFNEALLTPDELARYRIIRAHLAKHLSISEWRTDCSRSIKEDLDGELRRCQGAKFVIFDWLGGAIGSTVPDQHAVRLAYQAAADKLAELARKHELICIGMAQAHPQQSRHKIRVDSSMLAECKSLGRAATNVIGMSGLPVADESGDTLSTGQLYQDRQFFYVSKARKSVGGLKPFRRNFDFQQICDV